MQRTSTCIADHRKVFRGVFTKWREILWWMKHDRCQPNNIAYEMEQLRIKLLRHHATTDVEQWGTSCKICDPQYNN